MSEYIRNESTGVWERAGFDGIAYSDGEVREDGILAALRACRDVGSMSAELQAHIVDWPSEYHFSPVRHNLLRSVDFRAADRILELGCGCGAITRFLGESGAAVLAVEGSRRRAQIAAERCRDLPNVRIVCDNLATFHTPERFDVVTLIGVLEYARQFIDAEDPALECLRRARSWLAEGGTLMLAIENQLGLKYFAGCAEDHLGRPYYGIEGLYGARTAATFGRKQLTELLGRAGFPGQDWHYPFPDYKLPAVIVSEPALSSAQLDVPSLLFRAPSRDYGGSRGRAFDEALARRTAWNNGLLADTANSFLVMARAGGPPTRRAHGLVNAFNLSRHPRYCTTARFDLLEGGAARVSRSYVFPAQERGSADARFAHRLVEEDYVRGPLLVESLRALARVGWSMDALAQWAQPWASFLKRNVLPSAPRSLPPHFIDCTPFNCVVSESGKLVYIDAEWSAAGPVPLSWVFIRGLAISLEDCLRAGDPDTDRRAIVVGLGKRCGIELAEADFDLADKWETEFQAFCRLTPPASPLLGAMLDAPPAGDVPVFDALLEARRQTERVMNSRSMRITKPLRAATGLLRSLRAFLSSR